MRTLDPNLRKAGEKYSYTNEEIKEIIKCHEDIIYFAERYFYIVHPDRGKEKIDLYDWQKKVLKVCVESPDPEKKHLCMSVARQSGKTTVTTIFLTWFALFNKDKTIGIVAHKFDAAKDILRRIKMSYGMLPKFIQSGISDGGWNKESIILENGSRLLAKPTSTETLTSLSVNLLFLDEFAKVPEHIAEEFITSTYPVISSGKNSKIIMVSCVTDNTFTFTDQGIKQIKEFINYDMKGAYEVGPYKVEGKTKLNNGNILFNSCEKVPTKIITTAFGDLECSLEHKLWANHNKKFGWFKSSELQEGDYISLKYGMDLWGNKDDIEFYPQGFDISKKMFVCKEITNDLAYFLGVYLTDITGESIPEVLGHLGLEYDFGDNFHDSNWRDSFDEFLKHLRVNFRWEENEYRIPKKLMSLSREKTISLLSGIFDARGFSCNDKGKINLSLRSKEMIVQVQMLLLNLGIVAKLITAKTKKKELYQLIMDISNSKLFYGIVGFKNPEKQTNSELAVCKDDFDRKDVIPYARLWLRENYGVEMSKLNLFNGANPSDHMSRNKLLKDKECLLNLQYPAIDEMYEYIICDNVKWQKIKSIEDSENYVYDFSLDDIKDDFWCHSVLYNGYVGHQTPKGMNHYYEIFSKAARKENSNNFYPIKVGWWEVPGRDDNWKASMIRDIGKVRWNQEFACQFLGSNSTLIDADILERIKWQEPRGIKWNGLFLIYKYPESGGQYVLGVDPSKGIGKDYSVIQVLKINAPNDIEQVAIYRNNSLPPREFAKLSVSIAKYYNEAYMMVESNAIGQVVTEEIWYTHEYENMVNDGAKTLGILSTRKSKLKANLLLKQYMEKKWLTIVDERTVYELSRYEEIRPNVFSAGKKQLDDCVTSLLWGVYFLLTDIYEGDIDLDVGDNEFNIDFDETDDRDLPDGFDDDDYQGPDDDMPSPIFD